MDVLGSKVTTLAFQSHNLPGCCGLRKVEFRSEDYVFDMGVL